mgnify:CR=1 FL=1
MTVLPVFLRYEYSRRLTAGWRRWLSKRACRESLYRTLSPKGNPTLKTLMAELKAVGMKLSVEQGKHATG